MARLKLTFTEDHIKLIKTLRFGKINTAFYVEAMNNETEIRKVSDNTYDIRAMLKQNGEVVAVTSAPISILLPQENGDNLYGIDTLNLWGGTYIYEDMALILGMTDKIIEGTEEDPTGAKYDEETTKYFDELASFIVENLVNIESILHQFCTEGIKANVTYVCKPNENIWWIE